MRGGVRAVPVLWLMFLLVGFIERAGPFSPLAGRLGRALAGPFDFTDFAGAWAEHVLGFLAAGCLILAAAGAGRSVLNLLGCRSAARRPSGPIMSAAAGFTVLGTGVFGAGLAGLLHPVVLGPVVAAFGIRGLRRTGSGASWLSDLRPDGRAAAVAAGAVALACLFCVPPALAPELGWDALTYHLHVPERYLAAGRIFAMPHNPGSYFPFLSEMWFMLAHMIAGDAAAKCLNYSFLPATCLALASFGREVASRGEGLLAALIYAATPAVALLSGQCYNDLELAFLSLLAVRAACSGSGAGRALSGLLCGAALASKHLGAWTFLGCLVPWIACVPRGGRFLPALVVPCAVAFLPAVPWLARNFLAAANPFYPLLAGTFGATGWNPYIPSGLIPRPGAAVSGLLTGLPVFPFTVSVSARAIGVPLSPLAFGFLPAFLLAPERGRVKLMMAVAGLIGAGLWSASGSGEGRYLLPALALLSIPAAAGARSLFLSGPALRTAAACAIPVALAVQLAAWAGHVSQMYVPFRVAAGLERRDFYLSRALLPNWGYYPLAKLIGEKTPVRARILVFSDIVGHYLERDVVFDRPELMPPVAVRLTSSCRDPARLRKRFRQLGLGYVLYTPRIAEIEEACGCVSFPGGSADCYGRFWRRYAALALERGSMRLYRLRSETEAANGEAEPWLDWPGVQDRVEVAIRKGAREMDFREANRELAALARAAPELAWVRTKSAEMRLRERDFDAAGRELALARELGDDGAAYWLALSAVRTMKGDFPRAAEASAEAVARYPAPETYALYAFKLAAAGRTEAAREAVREAVRLDPASRYARLAADRLR